MIGLVELLQHQCRNPRCGEWTLKPVLCPSCRYIGKWETTGDAY